MIGLSHELRRVSASVDVFLIDRAHENVYDADNGTTEYQGPSRSYGWEAKASAQLAAHLSANAGLTQVSNAFFKGTSPREYVDSAPHTVANASVTLNGWRGLFASLRYRHVGHYLLVNPDDPADAPAAPYTSGAAALASGLDVMDFAASGKLRAGFEWSFSVDNLNDKRYWETQNLFNSRVTPDAAAAARVHGTPGYPSGVMAGLTWRFE
jgi:outer membrane receptor protein involved in Fe transport